VARVAVNQSVNVIVETGLPEHFRVDKLLEEFEELCCVHDGVGLRRSSLDSLKPSTTTEVPSRALASPSRVTVLTPVLGAVASGPPTPGPLKTPREIIADLNARYDGAKVTEKTLPSRQ